MWMELGKEDRSKEEGKYRWMVERQKDEGLVDGMMNIMKEDRRIEEYQEHTVLATKQKSPENKKF